VPEKPLPYAWETCMTMGDQWSFEPEENHKSTHRLIHLPVDNVGKGGNFLLNVGPPPDDQLPATAVQRLNNPAEQPTAESRTYALRPDAEKATTTSWRTNLRLPQ
jgi:alpha-L-fucosidase